MTAKNIAKRFNVSEDDLQRCKTAFEQADIDNSGYIDKSELRTLLVEVLQNDITEEEMQDMSAQYDQNNDSKLNFEEFLVMFVNCPIYKAEHLEDIMKGISKEARTECGDDRDHALVISHEGVPTEVVATYLRDEIRQMNACIQLPVALLIFASFSLSVLLHEKVDQLHALDKAFTHDIEENANFAFSGIYPFENGRMGHKSIYDVNSIADFWSWFSLGIVPLWWAAGWDVNEVRLNTLAKCQNSRELLEEWGWPTTIIDKNPELLKSEWNNSYACPEGQDNPDYPREWFGPAPPNDTPTYLYYHSVVGGARMRQERAEVGACRGEYTDYAAGLHTGQCAPDLGYWLKPEIRPALRSDASLLNRPGGETVHLLSKKTQKGIRNELRTLENKAWFGPKTSKIEILFTTYNPHMDAFTATYVLFFFNRAGHMHRMVQPVSFWLNPYHGWWNYAADALWLCLLAKILVEEGFDLVKHWGKHGFLSGTYQYFDFVNIVDWVNVCYGGVIVAFWIIHLQQLDELKGYLETASVEIPGSWTDQQTRESFYAVVDNIVVTGETRRVVLAMYPFVVVSRFFKAFSAQPRLSLVTKTIQFAIVDLVHFGLVFLCIFSLFTVAAIILFGQEMLEFANIGRAADSSFHILVGDFEWEKMKAVGRLPAGIWFWCYMWLVNMVMLNMLLAIVMDVYTEVKGGIGSNAETLWSQSHEIYERWRKRRSGLRVSLDYILTYLDHVDDGASPLTTISFMHKVPGLKDAQAARILKAALAFIEDQKHSSQSISEAMIDIQRLGKKLESVHKSVQSMVMMTELNSTATKVKNTIVQNTDEVKAQERFQPTSVGVPGSTSNLIAAPEWVDGFVQLQSEKTVESTVRRLNQLEARWESKMNDVSAQVERLAHAMGPLIAQARGDMARSAQPVPDQNAFSLGACSAARAQATRAFIATDGAR